MILVLSRAHVGLVHRTGRGLRIPPITEKFDESHETGTGRRGRDDTDDLRCGSLCPSYHQWCAGFPVGGPCPAEVTFNRHTKQQTRFPRVGKRSGFFFSRNRNNDRPTRDAGANGHAPAAEPTRTKAAPLGPIHGKGDESMVKMPNREQRNEPARADGPGTDTPIHERDRAFELSRRSNPDSTTGPAAREPYGEDDHVRVSASIDD